ncbi:MAG: DUF3829 domain-containing protein [Bacteroidota bacterium]
MKQAFFPRFWLRLGWLFLLLLAIGILYWWRGGDVPWVDEQEITEDLKKLEQFSPRSSGKEVSDLNFCVSCANLFTDSLLKTKEHYLGWLDDSIRGPIENQALVEGILPLPDPKYCLGEDLGGRVSSFRGYRESLGRVVSLLQALREYYRAGSYHQDGFALGRRLHGPLLLAFRDFEEADFRMRSELFPLLHATRVMLERQNPKLLKHPTLHHLRRFILLAEAGVGAGISQPRPAVPALKMALDSLRQSVNQGRIRDRRTPELPQFLATAETFVLSAEGYLDRQYAGSPLTESEKMLLQRGGGALVEGSLAALFAAYRQLSLSYASLGYEAETLYLLVPVSHEGM